MSERYQIPAKTLALRASMPESVNAEIHMEANESFIPTPSWMMSELAVALADLELNRYPDPLATRLCILAAKYYGVRSHNVTAGCGSDELINLIVSVLIPKEGRVLLCQPDFGMYQFYSGLHDVVCVATQRSNGVPDINALLGEAKATDVILLSNPCNPTGQGIAGEQILDMVRQAPCLVVIDEAYMDFWDQTVSSAVTIFDNLLVLRTASKSMGLAAIRLGFALANDTLTQCLRNAKSPYNLNALTQNMGIVAFRHEDYLRMNAKIIRKSTLALTQSLHSLLDSKDGWSITDTVTNFVSFHAPDATKVYLSLLEHGILIRQLGEMLRITAGSERENNQVIAALSTLL
jgi:histidinol-phosphate aminotransferase